MAQNSLLCADVPLRNYSLTCWKALSALAALATTVGISGEKFVKGSKRQK